MAKILFPDVPSEPQTPLSDELNTILQDAAKEGWTPKPATVNALVNVWAAIITTEKNTQKANTSGQ